MTREITSDEASGLISRHLTGYTIDRVSYHITGWELRLNSPGGPERLLSAAEIDVRNEEAMWHCLAKFPIDLNNTNEPNDIVVAIILFTATNKWPITQASIDRSGNLIITFGNQSTICCLANVEHIDWAWVLRDENDTKSMTCNSGPIFIHGNIFDDET